MAENFAIYRERFDAGKIDASDLNLQELDLQKEKTGSSRSWSIIHGLHRKLFRLFKLVEHGSKKR